MNNQTVVRSSWYERFACVGGECSLTCCCAAHWNISISQEDLLKYHSISGPFREEVLQAIDTDKMRFRPKREMSRPTAQEDSFKCALLTNSGWCKIVLNCGDEYLSETCDLFPRRGRFTNGYLDYTVGFGCPVVAGYLFDGRPLSFHEYPVYDVEIPTLMDEERYQALRASMDFLTNLMTGVKGYDAGKCFIYFDVINAIQSLIDTNALTKHGMKRVLSKYLANNVIEATMSECEDFNKDISKKAAMLSIVFRLSGFMFDYIYNQNSSLFADLETHIGEWQEDLKLLERDLNAFNIYRQQYFPDLVSKYLASMVFSFWITDDDESFAPLMKLYYYVLVFMEISAMSCWKSRGGIIDKGVFSVIISEISRLITYNNRLSEALSKSIVEVEEAVNFSIFLVPVY